MTNNIIYFDNSATTPLCPEAISGMERMMGIFGNPSSLHALGLDAEHEIRSARAKVMSALFFGRRATGSLIFTASGSEANNLAILGAVRAKKLRGAPRIITTDSEHPSVRATLDAAIPYGVEIVTIPTVSGVLDMDSLKNALTPDTIMVSLMLVNNETGARYKVEEAFRFAKRINPNVLAHVDAVQGFLKVSFTPDSLGCDLVTVSSHKIHGPKGVGALWVSDAAIKAKRLSPVIFGGGQENGFRSGTENTIGIAGFGCAAEAGLSTFKDDIAKIEQIRTVIKENLPSEVRLNQPAGDFATHIMSLTLPGIKSETMLHYLSGEDICISSGSACSSHSVKENYVLSAFGLTKAEADSTIRVSLSHMNTEDEARIFCEKLALGVANLIRIK